MRRIPECNHLKTLLLLLLLHQFNGLFSKTTWVSPYQKGKSSLDLNEARDDGISGCSGISWTICKQSVPRSTQITTPAPHHSIFADRMLFLTPNQQCQSTLKHPWYIWMTTNSTQSWKYPEFSLKIRRNHIPRLSFEADRIIPNFSSSK